MINHLEIYFVEDTEGLLIRELYDKSVEDADWPELIRDVANFEQWLTSRQMARWLDDGDYRVILDKSRQPIGFYTLQRIEEAYNGAHPLVSVEAGTYLIPTARGIGYNPIVKEQIRHQASIMFSATKLVFAIACENIRAQRALSRLPYEEEIITAEMTDSPWQALRLRRSFEQQKPVILHVQDMSISCS